MHFASSLLTKKFARAQEPLQVPQKHHGLPAQCKPFDVSDVVMHFPQYSSPSWTQNYIGKTTFQSDSSHLLKNQKAKEAEIHIIKVVIQ